MPTHFIGVLAEVEKRRQAAGLGEGKLEGFERLRTGIAAGAPVPIDLMKRLISEMGLTELTNAYGMSECTATSNLCAFAHSVIQKRKRGMYSLDVKIGPDELMSELRSPVSFQTTCKDPVEKRVETVGRVQPHVRAKIIDPSGNVVPLGTPGEICTAGYLLQKG